MRKSKTTSMMTVVATAMIGLPSSSVVTVTAMGASHSSSSGLETQQQQQQQRLLEDGWYRSSSSWGSPEHGFNSGKSGKSYGSGKSGKSSGEYYADNVGWNAGPGWGPPPPPPHPPGWYDEYASSYHSEGKSGKSKSSKGGDENEGDGGSWVLLPPPPHPGWNADGWSSSAEYYGSNSGKSGKSGGSYVEGGHEDGSWEDGSPWYRPWGPPPPPPPPEFSGKAGKSKSIKGSSDNEGWFGPWEPPSPPGWYPPEMDGKSGKAKSSKSDHGHWEFVPVSPGWDDGWSSGAAEHGNDSGSGKSGKSGSGGSGKSGKSSAEEPEPTPTWSSPPPPKEEVKEEEHQSSSTLNTICFEKGTRVECSTWGDDGHGGDSGHGSNHDKDAISIPFTYTVDTNGKVDPKSTISSMENAILEDVAGHVEDNDMYASFSGKISAAPADSISDDDWCGDGHAIRCSVVKGEMSVSPAWSGDGHAASAFNACSACDIVKDSMEGKDYTDIDGVTGAKYRNCDAECDGTVIAGAATVVQPQDNDLSSGALFAIWLVALAAIALLALLLARKRRKPVEVNEDMSLISNDLDGNHYGYSEDPYANTIDVHKCTSIYCNCNSKSKETTFLPAPRTVDIARTMSENGLSRSSSGSTSQKANEVASDLNQELVAINESRGSIMRMPLAYQSAETSDRPLTPVNEVAHDSEIDTELESVADDDTNVPPPPPIAFHPSYNKRQHSNDEISI